MLQIDIHRRTLAANQEYRHNSQKSTHFRQQCLRWWGVRAAASSLLPSASLIAVCQMMRLRPYTYMAVPSPAWVALEISVDKQSTV